MIWDTSIWRLGCSNRSKIRSAQKCYLCLRYVVSPMCPGRTQIKVVGANGFEPSTSWSRTRRASQAALRPDCLDLTTVSESSDEGHRPSRSDSGRASQAALRPDRHAQVHAPAPSATIRLAQLQGCG